MNRSKLYLGFACIAISYASYFAPPSPITHFVLGAFLMAGLISVFEFVTRRYGGYSLVKDVRSSTHSFLVFAIATTVAGILLEAVFSWLLHLWTYPEWSTRTYLLFFVPGFIAYWLVLLEGYLAIRTLLSGYLKNKMVLILASCLIAMLCIEVVMEMQNIPAGLWRYSHWSLTLGAIAGIPVTVFLTSPIQYFFILPVLAILKPMRQEVFFG